MRELILVLDFGGQYKELIARKIRAMAVYAEIGPGSMTVDEIRELAPAGIILTGGPNSVYAADAPRCDPRIFSLGIPVLGICYGMQLMCHTLGGAVRRGAQGEYGSVAAALDAKVLLFRGVPPASVVLMSHGDNVTKLPVGFVGTATTPSCPHAACEHVSAKLFGLQFHPETAHTKHGNRMLRNFVFDVCGVSGSYKLGDYATRQIAAIRQKVGAREVLLALSGGVDSSVCAALLARAVPGQLTCIFVDHGCMRMNEGDTIEAIFAQHDLRFRRVNAGPRFLAKLAHVVDPETKRKIIGTEFIRVFEEEAAKIGNIGFLAQGTIYPDVVESGGKHGATIKSHHNVGGLPVNLAFAGVIEPLAGLFKDEVRALGRKLGLPKTLVERQPFPGPGLAIRVMGEVTETKLAILRAADAILHAELDGMRRKPDQYFAVLTDTRTVGVKGDDRTYDPVIAIRAVVTGDFMTCEHAPLSHKLLRRVSARITSEIPAVSRVVYDVTSKPPATVEWE